MIVDNRSGILIGRPTFGYCALVMCPAILMACSTLDSAPGDEEIDRADIADAVDGAGGVDDSGDIADADGLDTTGYGLDSAALSASRSFICGYALPGNGCDNGRISRFVTTPDLASAHAACPGSQPAGYSDFCYVIAADGGIADDVSQCASVPGSWRSGNSCCNLNGTRSCPVTRRYICGYALPGNNCNNGRISRFVNAADLSAARAACPASQPAGYTDFCYVIDSTAGTAADAVQCAAQSGSWRPGNSCCNFMGTLSCP